MPQVLKNQVRERIHRAALQCFAEVGFSPTTMRQIAERSQVSLGNLYRYYPGKEALFSSILPATFPAQLLSLIEKRVQALRGVRDIQTLPEDGEFFLVSDELLRFCIDHKWQVILLLHKAEGSPHDSFPKQLIQQLLSLAINHAQLMGWAYQLTQPEHQALENIYHNFVETITNALLSFETEEDLRVFLHRFEAYHLHGLRGFFKGILP